MVDAFEPPTIEAWWRALKHQWLFLNTLDSVETIERLVRFYVKEHKKRLPHSAFNGETPDAIASVGVTTNQVASSPHVRQRGRNGSR